MLKNLLFKSAQCFCNLHVLSYYFQPFGNASSTSEEDEIIKKEREIIEILEKEEQWRYGTNTVLSPSDHHQVGKCSTASGDFTSSES